MDSGKGVEILANYHLTAQEAAEQVCSSIEEGAPSEHGVCKIIISQVARQKDSICSDSIRVER